MMYFVPLNSSLGKGRTLGKRLMKIHVVDTDGQHISPSKSFLRYSVLTIPFYLNGVIVPPSVTTSLFWGTMLSLIVFGGLLSIPYLYIFNRKTRQSLHDLAAGTYVIRTSAPYNPVLGSVWKGHLIVVGVLFILVSVAPSVIKFTFVDKPFFKNLISVQGKIQDTGKLHTVTVTSGTTRTMNYQSEGGEASSNIVKYLSVNAIIKEPDEEAKGLADDIARIVFDSYTDIDKINAVVIQITKGFDIGIAKLWKREQFNYNPYTWEGSIKQSP
jgi:hypothetical protein